MAAQNVDSWLTIEEVTDVTSEHVAAFARLLPQLSPGAPSLSMRDLEDIVHAVGATLFVAVASRQNLDARIVGSATLIRFRIPSGQRARLESVVVDAGARGQGIGEALCRAAIGRAVAYGATTVDLTSAPTREAANRMYERLGFERRDTNVYRLSLPNGKAT